MALSRCGGTWTAIVTSHGVPLAPDPDEGKPHRAALAERVGIT